MRRAAGGNPIVRDVYYYGSRHLLALSQKPPPSIFFSCSYPKADGCHTRTPTLSQLYAHRPFPLILGARRE